MSLKNGNIAGFDIRSAGAISKFNSNPIIVWGLSFPNVSDLISAISAAPSDFPDGTPVFIQTINFNDQLSETPVSESGWVIIYAHVPIPVTPPSANHLARWISDYDSQDLTSSWVDQDDDGRGVFFTNTGGSPTPSDAVGLGAVCSSSVSAFESDRIHPLGGSEGLVDWVADQLSVGVGSIA